MTLRVALTIWTIGHSTRSADEFRAVLSAYEIELVADVRRFPGSRRLPQFGAAALEADLASAGLAYCGLTLLGGRRTPAEDSVNTSWRHRAFRGYADYTATEDFAAGFFELLMLANGLRTAVMCAELLWWRCHRRILADLLTSLDTEVIHIRDASFAEPHRISLPARIVRGRLTYSA